MNTFFKNIKNFFFNEEIYLNMFFIKCNYTDTSYKKYYILEVPENSIERCTSLRKSYKKALKKNKKENYKSIFNNFPINASTNLDLLGEYISQMPFVKYLEKTKFKNTLILKLDSKSINTELNFFSNILRENILFFNLELVFDYDENKNDNFLKLNHIFYNDNRIYKDNILWSKLIQSAFTELFLIISLEHAIWHLIVSNIICFAKRSLKNTEILKIFELAEENVIFKAAEVKILLFGTNLVFKQILNNNEKFMNFVKNKINLFFNNFNIDTIYKDYLINDLNPNQNWITGLNSNIVIIKKFVNKVVNKKNISNENNNFKNFIEGKNKDFKNISIEKYLNILFVVGTAFHSTTFEFTRLIFTDVFYNQQLNKLFYSIAIGTIVGDIDTTFGDINLYKGKYYKDEIDYLFNKLEINRNNVEKMLDDNKIFKNYNFSTKQNILKYYQANTFTTYL